jgi:hypothetical protein
MNDSLSQANKRRRGDNFQEEIRESWKLIPNCYRIAIPGTGGSRPADSLILLPSVNILAELKRTAGESFKLSFLRKNQLKALIDFEKIMTRNAGVVFVSFLNEVEDRDICYVFRLTSMLAFMKDYKKVSVSLGDLLNLSFCLTYPINRIPESGLWDLRGVEKWLRCM